MLFMISLVAAGENEGLALFAYWSSMSELRFSTVRDICPKETNRWEGQLD
jgi:hypothetical protein